MEKVNSFTWDGWQYFIHRTKFFKSRHNSACENYTEVIEISSEDWDKASKQYKEILVKACNNYDSLVKALEENIVTCKYFSSIQLPHAGAKEIIKSQLESNQQLLNSLKQ